MSSSVTYHFTTTASTNLQPVGSADQGGTVKGLCVANVATAMFIKFFWGPQPTVGTTVPNLTVAVPANTLAFGPIAAFPDGITGNGQLWVAVTANAVDNDSANATAGAVVTLLLE